MKRVLPLLPGLLLVALLAVGCKKDDAVETTGSTGQTASQGLDEDELVKRSDAEDVGPELRHAGYQYYGLGNDKVLVYDFSLNGMTEEGKQEVFYQGLKDGVPTYKIVRSGALSQLGEETLGLKPEGVYLNQTTMGDLDQSVLALPSNLAIGQTWSDTRTITRIDGKVLKMESNYKVERNESIDTPAGKFDTLLITSTGKITYAGETSTFKGSINHATGIGTIKLTIEADGANDQQTGTVVTLKAIE